MTVTVNRKPEWLRVRLAGNGRYLDLKRLVNTFKLNTVCESALCPNIGECWGAGTATFMILGDICTRSCQFCAVKTGKPRSPDPLEPYLVAHSVKIMGIKFCVITSVDRDDLKDCGSRHWAETVLAIRRISPETKIETLIPDFQGKTEFIDNIIAVRPDIVSHNIETVWRLTKIVRVQAKYERSLFVLSYLSSKGMITKSGIMVGLGETKKEIFQTIEDLRDAGVSILTIGQYLQPTKNHLPVIRYVPPEEFNEYREYALSVGIKYVESGPLVRSSYHAERGFKFLFNENSPSSTKEKTNHHK